MKRAKLVLLLCLALILSSCGKGGNEVKDTNKLSVVTSFFPNYDMVKKIGGDKVEVVNLTQTGDAHTFEPKIQDMEKIYDSKLLVVNGAGFEPWLDKVLEGKKDLNVLKLSDGLELLKTADLHNHEDEDHDHDEKDHDHDHDHEEAEHDHDHEEADHDHEKDSHNEHEHDHDEEHDHGHEGHHHHGEYDPHTWLSPKLYAKMLEKTKDKLIEIDTANKDYYTENYNKAAKEVEQLIKEYDENLSKYSGKKIVTPHEAFNYMLHEYGIEQIAIEGINSVAEPNAAKMKEIVDKMKENNVKTVFYEYNKSDKVAKSIANEIGGNVKEITTLEVISDKDASAGADYISLMKMNLKNIVDSFEGK
ncbi:metal ABC transporter substrate-binding protein [Helcococcus kunzii]|uniref:metal ABC transporter substrate-binding protein n=1 Tax=Helcococcus kunzii TaxID=40091 RepID=UPI0024ACB2E9|nr:zinc ABC transporter substrate-binding protein [Helcococcus kunzii]